VKTVEKVTVGIRVAGQVLLEEWKLVKTKEKVAVGKRVK
jgi:hypothetical protein